jgi:hypothetical protein
MQAEEIKEVVCQGIKDDMQVYLFLRKGNEMSRLNIGFNALEVVGMAALAVNEINQLMAGDASLAPTPWKREIV